MNREEYITNLSLMGFTLMPHKPHIYRYTNIDNSLVIRAYVFSGHYNHKKQSQFIIFDDTRDICDGVIIPSNGTNTYENTLKQLSEILQKEKELCQKHP